MAPEAWPEGLGLCPCRVPLFLPSPHVPLLPAPCAPGGGAAALTCLQLEATAVGGAETVIALEGAPSQGVSRSLARPSSQLASCVMF